MTWMKRRQLTGEERADAERLQAVWLHFKRENTGATQEWLAAESGLGTQGAVGQYLRGVIPLNLEALLSMAKVIKANPRDISPRLLDLVDAVDPRDDGAKPESPALADSLKLTIETAAELRLLTVYRLADADGRGAIDDVVDVIQSHLDQVRAPKQA